MGNKRFIIHLIIMILVLLFSLYEVIYSSYCLANYDVMQKHSYASLIVIVVLFCITLVLSGIVIILMFIKRHQKKYYILKK